MKATKKRHPSDATLRNVRAASKKLASLEREIKRLKELTAYIGMRLNSLEKSQPRIVRRAGRLTVEWVKGGSR